MSPEAKVLPLPPARDAGSSRPIPLPVFDPTDWQGQSVPERRFIVAPYVPLEQVTLLGGDGGTGKSLLMQQLAAAVVLGEKWLGLPVKTGSVLYLACEDSRDELHIRFADICAGYGRRLGELRGLQIVSGLTEDATFFSADDQDYAGHTTERFDEFRQLARDLTPILIVLDTVSDIYAANENLKRQVKQFIKHLLALAEELNCAIVLLAHPSKASKSSGDNYAGSVQWNSSVRSRLFLEADAKRAGAGDEVDPDARTLRHEKTNLGAPGAPIRMRWQAGAFVQTETQEGTLDRIAAASRADRVFLKLLDWHAENGINVSATQTANNFAPTIFGKHPDREDVTKDGFRNALHRLLRARAVVTEHYGSPSKQRSRLVRGPK